MGISFWKHGEAVFFHFLSVKNVHTCNCPTLLVLSVFHRMPHFGQFLPWAMKNEGNSYSIGESEQGFLGGV